MKSLRFTLPVVLLSLSLVAFAQHDEPPSAAPKSDADKTFDQLKTLAGTWEGVVKTFPQQPGMDGKLMNISFRVTSMGHTLMHEMSGTGRPDDPITMFVVDGDRLLLTHYCAVGNQPRMVASLSADGKSVIFDFLDATNLVAPHTGHMNRVIFSSVDANHHTEEWRFLQDGKEIVEMFDLRRKG